MAGGEGYRRQSRCIGSSEDIGDGRERADGLVKIPYRVCNINIAGLKLSEFAKRPSSRDTH